MGSWQKCRKLGEGWIQRIEERGNSFLRSPSLREACDSQGAHSGWMMRPIGVPTDLTCLLPSKHRPRLRLAKGDSSYLAAISLSLGLTLVSSCCPQLIPALSGVCLFLHRELSVSASETRARVEKVSHHG